MGPKKKNKKKKKKKNSARKKPVSLTSHKFSAPPSEEKDLLPPLEVVLKDRLSASALAPDVLGDRLAEAQEAFVRALTEGWDCPWTPRSAALKIREFLGFLDLECSRNYSNLSVYSITKNRSSRVNTIFLAFNVKIHALILLARFEKSRDADLDLDYLAKEGVLMYEDVAKLTQTELYEAIQCVASKWNDIRPSDALWKYVFALQKRAAVLCAMRGGIKTFDGREIWKRECPGEYLAASQEYVSDLATQFALFFRARDIRADLLRKTVAPLEPQYADLDRLARNVGAWLNRQIQTYEDGSFRGQVKSLVLENSKRPGESERYSRAHNGVMSTDVPAVLDVSRPNLEVTSLTDLGKKGIRDFLDESRAGVFVTSLVLYKIFHAYVLVKTEFSWWDYCFLGEADCMEKSEILRSRKMPVVVQVMGSFDVFYKGELYRTETANRALALWTAILLREHEGVYTLINGKWDLTILFRMFRMDDGEEGDEMETDEEESDEAYEDAIIELD